MDNPNTTINTGSTYAADSTTDVTVIGAFGDYLVTYITEMDMISEEIRSILDSVRFQFSSAYIFDISPKKHPRKIHRSVKLLDWLRRSLHPV